MAHVPLIVRLPGAIPAGRKIAEPVSLVDILPTVLDVPGRPPLPDVDGTSLLPLLVGTTDRLPRDGVFTQAQSEGIFDWFDLTGVRNRTHACIHNDRTGATECFDRRLDPWERSTPLDVVDTTPDVHAMSATLLRYVQAAPPIVPRWAPPNDATAATMPDGGLVSPAQLQELRALGYDQ